MARNRKLLEGFASALKCIDNGFKPQMINSLNDFMVEAENYREMMSIPLLEFIDTDPASIAEWFFEKSRGPTWASSGVGALTYGDVILIDRSLVMYVPSDQGDIILPNCPNYKLIKLRYKNE